MTVAQLTDQQIAELVRRYQARLGQTAATLGTAASEAWANLGSWNKADIERLAAQLAATATAAQAHAAALAVGFVGLAASVSVPSGVTPLNEIDWAPAFHAYWKSLTNTDWEEALQAGANAVDAVGFDAVQFAARDAARQVDQREPRITGWQRVPDGGACSWCIEVSGATYHSAESASFGHNRCGCAVVPV